MIRVAFVIGGSLALVIVFLRQFVPESPRWLMTHGKPQEAERGDPRYFFEGLSTGRSRFDQSSNEPS